MSKENQYGKMLTIKKFTDGNFMRKDVNFLIIFYRIRTYQISGNSEK